MTDSVITEYDKETSEWESEPEDDFEAVVERVLSESQRTKTLNSIASQIVSDRVG